MKDKAKEIKKHRDIQTYRATEENTVIGRMRSEFPKTPEHFSRTVKEVLESQVLEVPAKPVKRKKKRFMPVLVAAVIMCTAVVTVAETNGLGLIRKWLRTEDIQLVENYIQDGVSVCVELKDTPFEEPLWELADFWYDGATLVFTGTPTEEGSKYDTGSDHIYINGRDCLMNYYENEETGGKYFCQVLVNKEVLEGQGYTNSSENHAGEMLEVELPLKAWGIKGLVGKQIYRFTVKQVGDVNTEADRIYPLVNGEVKVHKITAAVSGISMDFTYQLRGEGAEEAIQKIHDRFFISDDAGNMKERQYSSSLGDAYQDADGNWCRHITVEDLKGLDCSSSYYELIPYVCDTDEDGKWIPGTEKKIPEAAFTILMEEMQ